MFSHMNDCVHPEHVAQPNVEGEVVVRRDQIGGVISLCRVNVVAARWLDADDGIAELVDAELERRPRCTFWVCHTGQEERIVLRRPPTFGYLLLQGPGKSVEIRQVDVHWEGLSTGRLRTVRQPVCWPCKKLVHEFFAVLRRLRDQTFLLQKV